MWITIDSIRMYKIILLFSIIFSSPMITSISPPKFPETFFTGFKYTFQNSNTTLKSSGSIAGDDTNKLFKLTQLEEPSGYIWETLFNKHLYYLTYDKNGDITGCVCNNSTYEDLGLPYFSDFKHFIIFALSETDITWQVTDYLGNEMVLSRVKRVTPNFPEEIMTINTVPGHSRIANNFTYIGFQDSQPDINLFTVPSDCTKVICRSESPPTIPSIFPKFNSD